MEEKSLTPKKETLQKATVYTALTAAVAVLICVFFLGLKGQNSIFYYFDESILKTRQMDWNRYWSFLPSDRSTDASHLVNACNSLDLTYMVATCWICSVTLLGTVVFSLISIVAFFEGNKDKDYRNCIFFSIVAILFYCTGTLLLFAMENYSVVLPTMAREKVVLNPITIVGLIVAFVALIGIICCKTVETTPSVRMLARIDKKTCSLICIVTALTAFLLTAFISLRIENLGSSNRGTPFSFALMMVSGWGEKSVGSAKGMEMRGQFAQIFFGLTLTFLAMSLLRQIRNVVCGTRYKSGFGWAFLATFCSLLLLLLTSSMKDGAEKMVGNGSSVSLAMPILVVVFNLVNFIAAMFSRKKCE